MRREDLKGYVKWLNENFDNDEEKNQLEKKFGMKEIEKPKMPEVEGGEIKGPKLPEATAEEPKEENPVEEPKKEVPAIKPKEDKPEGEPKKEEEPTEEEPKEEKPEEDKFSVEAKTVIKKDLEQFGYIEYMEKIAKGDKEAAEEVLSKGYVEVFPADDLDSNEKIKKGASKAKEELGIE